MPCEANGGGATRGSLKGARARTDKFTCKVYLGPVTRCRTAAAAMTTTIKVQAAPPRPRAPAPPLLRSPAPPSRTTRRTQC